MKKLGLTLGFVSGMALVAALPERKLTKEFLESEIGNVEYVRIGEKTTHCTITTKSGFTFTGESACVDPNNFDRELGEKFAYEQAFEKMWLPYGFWLHKALADHDNRLQPPSDDNKIEAQDWMIPDDATFSFGDAVEILKKGVRVARAGWNGKGMWLVLVHPDDDADVPPQPTYAVAGIMDDATNGCLPWIGMKTADNKFVPWLASQTDVLAEDWQIVEQHDGRN